MTSRTRQMRLGPARVSFWSFESDTRHQGSDHASDGYGSDTQRRVQAGCGSHCAQQRPDTASGCVRFWDRAFDARQVGSSGFGGSQGSRARCRASARERTASQREPHTPGFEPEQKTVRGAIEYIECIATYRIVARDSCRGLAGRSWGMGPMVAGTGWSGAVRFRRARGAGTAAICGRVLQ